MGIPIGGGRGRRRRSYADYRTARRPAGPRSDPFRVVMYLLLIVGALWVTLNPAMVLALLQETPSPTAPQASGLSAAPNLEGAPNASPTAVVDPASYAGLAQEAYLAGRLTEAISYYRQAGEQAPNTVEFPLQAARLLLFRSAMEYGEQRDATLEDALDAANDAILADPFHPGGYAILGKIKDWQGFPQDGLNDIQRALEADENYAPAHSYLAEVLIDLERWDEAVSTIEYAVSLDPNNVDILRDYGYILESLGDYEGAVVQYEKALQIHPNLPYLKMALARAYRSVGRYDEAIDLLFEVDTLEPGSALVMFELGRTYETYVGDFESALDYYQHAVEIDEHYPLPWVRIGALQYSFGDYRAAAQAYERAIGLGVESAEVYSQLGMAYINLGECSEGLPSLEKARGLAEDDERILDLVNGGYETCAEPIPTPDTESDNEDS